MCCGYDSIYHQKKLLLLLQTWHCNSSPFWCYTEPQITIFPSIWRKFSPCTEPFRQKMVQYIVLNRTIPFTKEPLKKSVVTSWMNTLQYTFFLMAHTFHAFIHNSNVTKRQFNLTYNKNFPLKHYLLDLNVSFYLCSGKLRELEPKGLIGFPKSLWIQ